MVMKEQPFNFILWHEEQGTGLTEAGYTLLPHPTVEKFLLPKVSPWPQGQSRNESCALLGLLVDGLVSIRLPI